MKPDQLLIAFAQALGLLDQSSREFCELWEREGSGAPNRVCDELLSKCREVFEAESAALLLIRTDNVVLEAIPESDQPGGLAASFGKARQYRLDLLENGRYDGICGFVACTGQDFAANSQEEIEKLALDSLAIQLREDELRTRSVIAVALKIGAQTAGVFKLQNKRSNQGFTETDLRLFRTLAEIFGLRLQQCGFLEHWNSTRATPEDLELLAKRFDRFHMRAVIEGIPRQVETALAQALPPIPKGPFKGVAVAGMGGSALPVDVIQAAFAQRLTVPLEIVRHYELPASLGCERLVIGSSFSGNTEETLSAIEGLPADAENVVCITAGGRLRELARERHYPLIVLPIEQEPAGFQPRSAVGYFVTFFARVLMEAGVMTDAKADLATVPSFLRSIDLAEPAEQIARWLQDKIPVVYCDDPYHFAIARTTKIKFNENSKRPAFFNVFPETNHNEMIGFMNAKLGNFGILYFHDPLSHARIRQRFRVMKEVSESFGLKHLSFREWTLPGDTKIQKIFAAMAFAERCSYNLALLDGFDPTPVDMVEQFKKALVN